MIFWELLYTFLKIGIFNFGGGLAMISLIQNEVVEKHAWLTAQEFTDIVAISQMTPGPVGINTATYAGYTAVMNAGFGTGAAFAGAFIASFAVMLLPMMVMLLITRFLLKHRDNPDVKQVLSVLRLTVLGLIAAAALLLITPETFGTRENLPQLIISIAIFAAVFTLSMKFKKSPITLMLLSGAAGLVLYGMCGL